MSVTKGFSSPRQGLVPEPGMAATITLGSVTTGAAGTSVIITNSGTSSAAVFNFTIPRGDTGAPGTNATNPNFSASASSVAAGGSPTASITGTYPNLTINLGIPTGATGATPTITIGTVTTLAAGASATASFTGTALNLGIPQGIAGTSPSLSNTAALALGTASAGIGGTASRTDHVHPLPSGLLTFLGTATLGETLIIGISLGVRRYTGTISGLTTGDRIIAVLNGTPSNGSLQDVYVSAANTWNAGLLVPALGIAAVINVPVAFYKIS